MEGEPVRFRSEIWKLKIVVGKTFAPYYSSGLFMLELLLLEHLADSLERFGSLLFMDAGPFEHFDVLMKKSCRIKSWRLSMRMHDTVEKTKSALDSMRRPEREVHGGVFGSFVSRNRKCVESGVGYLVRDLVCCLGTSVERS